MAQTLAVTLLSLLSVVIPKLALPAAFLTLVGFLTLPKTMPPTKARASKLLLVVGAVAAAVAVLRFVALEAVPGIVQGGKDAAAKNAVSRLRELVFAEDALRKHAFLDADHDGVGSAGFIGELSGTSPARSGAPLPPVLNERYHELVTTREGVAAKVGGYLYMVCLPAKAGGMTAQASAPLNEELAERRFIAYAWPAAPSNRIESAFFIDEHERILVSKNLDGKDPRYVGADFAPDCGAALQDSKEWQVWMNKKPRSALPGDFAAPP